MSNEELYSRCLVDSTEMQIDKINPPPYGHVHLVCPKCGWEMSVRHSLCPDIDKKLRMTENYYLKIIME